MSDDDWITIAEFETAAPAYIVSSRLTDEGVPNRVVGSGYRGPANHYIWVPPEWKEFAQKILSAPAVEEADLAREALSYPPPDDV